jgi:Predicted transcriptional regulator
MTKNPEIIVPADQTVFEDHIVCMFDGSKRKLMHRHVLATYGMTWDEYKAYCGLPEDYPAIAPSYAHAKREIAKKMKLGGGTFAKVKIPETLAKRAADLAKKEKMSLDELVEHLLTEHILSFEYPVQD